MLLRKKNGINIFKQGNVFTVDGTENINIDKTAPVVILNATLDEIWPPNGKMVDVLIEGSSIDDNLDKMNLINHNPIKNSLWI